MSGGRSGLLGGVPDCRPDFASSPGPIDLSGKKVFVAGGAAVDGAFPRYKAELAARLTAIGATVVGSAGEAELQLMLVYEGSQRGPVVPGWGGPTKLVGIDLSRVQQPTPRPTFAGRRKLAFDSLRQLHFFAFGAFMSTDIAIADAIDLMFANLNEPQPPDWTTQRRSISFSGLVAVH